MIYVISSEALHYIILHMKTFATNMFGALLLKIVTKPKLPSNQIQVSATDGNNQGREKKSHTPDRPRPGNRVMHLLL